LELKQKEEHYKKAINEQLYWEFEKKERARLAAESGSDSEPEHRPKGGASTASQGGGSTGTKGSGGTPTKALGT